MGQQKDLSTESACGAHPTGNPSVTKKPFVWQQVDLVTLQTDLVNICEVYCSSAARSLHHKRLVLWLMKIVSTVESQVEQSQLTTQEQIWQISYCADRVLSEFPNKFRFKKLLARILYLGLNLGDTVDSMCLHTLLVALRQAKQAMYEDIFSEDEKQITHAEGSNELKASAAVAQRLALQAEHFPFVSTPDSQFNTAYNQLLQQQFYPINQAILYFKNAKAPWQHTKDSLIKLRDTLLVKAANKINDRNKNHINEKHLCKIKKVVHEITQCMSPIAQSLNNTVIENKLSFKQVLSLTRKRLLPYRKLVRFLQTCSLALFMLLGAVVGLIGGVAVTGLTQGADGARSALVGVILGVILFVTAWRWLQTRKRHDIKGKIRLFLNSLSKNLA
ncbi:MAG: hypothetical protein V3V61_05410 [Gammaproteobacteria bacterium]